MRQNYASTLRPASAGQAGFTLLELVIVLGIAGIIFSGLWALLSSGNTQLQAQTEAQQYRQLIAATKSYIQDNYNVGVLGPVNPNTSVPLPLNNLNSYLPSNFSSTDAFGQHYNIVVQNMDVVTGAAGATKWRFMVCSTGGSAISDKTGAQISSLIGSEGGFVYSQPTPGCSDTPANPPATTACGSYNSFQFNMTTPVYAGTCTGGVGHMATLSYTSYNSTGSAPWLARVAGYDPGTFYSILNNGYGIFLGGNPINMALYNGVNNGGSINMDGGSLNMATSATDTINPPGSLNMNGGNINMAANLSGGALNMAQGTISDPNLIWGVNSSIDVNGTKGVDITVPGETPYGALPPVALNIWGCASDADNCKSRQSGTSNNNIILAVNGQAQFTGAQAGTFVYTSDRSLKKNFTPIDNALDKLLKLKPYNFEWKQDGKKSIGFVAQDVQEVFPEIVSSIGGGKLGVDYAKLVAPIVAALQELKQENAALKQELDALKAKKP